MNIRMVMCTLFILLSSVSSAFVDVESKNVKLLRTLKMRFCDISFVTVDGKEFLVKQKNSLNKILGVVRDALTAHIAKLITESFGTGPDIAHCVIVIAAKKRFVGKPRDQWPATIHTIAPGKMVKEQSGPYNALKIKQADIGLTRDIIKWTTHHMDLIKIVALDLFLCNHDRHRGNIFYDRNTKHFCAIDMDSAFKYNLCALACRNLKAMLRDKNSLSPREMMALVHYKIILQKLIDAFTGEQIIELYDQFAQEAGLVKGSIFYTEKLERLMMANKQTIRDSRNDLKELMQILDKITKKVKKMGYSIKKFKKSLVHL